MRRRTDDQEFPEISDVEPPKSSQNTRSTQHGSKFAITQHRQKKSRKHSTVVDTRVSHTPPLMIAHYVITNIQSSAPIKKKKLINNLL